jgi:membrane protein DedA with SNARE-associated domain
LLSLEDLFPFNTELGYIGILVVSFVFSIIPFVPIPYFPILITASLNSNFNPHIIALTSALGVVGAKTIIFFISYYGRKILSDKTKKRMRPLQNLVSRYGWFGAFVAALTPIPDDIVYIPLGFARYSPWKFATATFAGKFIMNQFIVWGSIFLGRPFVEDILSSGATTNTASLIIAAIGSIAVLAAIVYFSLKIDWAKLIGRWFPWALEDNDDLNDNDDSNNKNDHERSMKEP